MVRAAVGEGVPLTMAQISLVEDVRTQGMIGAIVSSFLRAGAAADADELASWAQEAVMRAALRFDPRHGVVFCTYASYWVKGHILRSLRREWFQRHPALSLVLDAPSVASEEDPNATPEESRVQFARELNSYMADRVLEVMHAPPPASPEDQLAHQQSLFRLRRAINSLPTAYRTLLQRHHQDDVSLDALASELGVSPSTIDRRHKKAKQLLVEAMKTAQASVTASRSTGGRMASARS